MCEGFWELENAEQRQVLRHLHQTGSLFWYLHLFVVFLPVLGVFWLPVLGPWIQVAVLSLGLVLSGSLFKVSQAHSVHGLEPLNRGQVLLAVSTWTLALIAAALNQFGVSQNYSRCRAAITANDQANPFAVGPYYTYRTCTPLQYDALGLALGGAALPVLCLLQTVAVYLQSSTMTAYPMNVLWEQRDKMTLQLAAQVLRQQPQQSQPVQQPQQPVPEMPAMPQPAAIYSDMPPPTYDA